MKTDEIFIVKTKKGEESTQVKAVLRALKVKFEVAKENSPYNPAIVAKIKKSKSQYKRGKYTRVTKKNLDDFLNQL